MSQQRISLSDQRLQVCGLPHGDHDKHLWRLPAAVQAEMPLAVAEQSRFAAGARLRFRTDASSLKLVVEAFSDQKQQGIDCLVNGLYWRTLWPQRGEAMHLTVFQDLPSQWRELEIYCPVEQEIKLSGVLINTEAQLAEPSAYGAELPIVFYGSSVVQGSGAGLACMSYPAILSRALQMDVMNWGFYGAGKAEPEVVAQVCSQAAAVFVLDLGKSYGRQDISVYQQMLRQIREAQPDTPIVVVTPIFSAREHFDSRFLTRSQGIRQVMNDAAQGIDKVTVVDGLALLGADDWSGLSADGLHPNDKGYEVIARRLQPILEGVLAI